jgi:hypothetical protein
MSMNDFLTTLQEEGYIDEEKIRGIFENEKLQKFFKKETNKKKSSCDRAGEYYPDKCQARIWREGYDNIQCEHDKIDACFCTRHSNKVKEHGTWWLGIITETKPENPIHYNGTIHSWRSEVIVDEVKESQNSDEEKPKRRRGRPKGSKNKNKKTETKDGSSEELSANDIMKLISEKEKESNANEEDENTYILDEISYFKNEDGSILNMADFSLIGMVDNDGKFKFLNDNEEEKHKLLVSK